jgi:hypothetical protein
MLIAGQSEQKSSGSSGRIANGVYGKRGVITAIKQIPGKELGNYKPDVYIEFTVKSGAYDNTVSMFGHFNRDDITQKITGWGLASRIDQTFARFGAYEGLTDEQKALDGVMFKQDVFDNMLGKPAFFLSYVHGRQRDKDKPAYRNYGYLLSLDESLSDEDHFKIIYDVLQGDSYAMKQVSEGRAYLRESQDRYESSKTNNSTSATELVYGTPTASASSDDLMF